MSRRCRTGSTSLAAQSLLLAEEVSEARETLTMRIAQKSIMLALAIVFANAPAMAQKRGGTLTTGIKAGIPHYDMQATTSYGIHHRTAQHYSTLLTFDWANYPKLAGDIAESWTVAPDHLTFTFKIREGIKFHDGTPLTAKDVAASYERLRNPKEGVISPRKALFASIKSIEVPDDHTIVFKMAYPDSFALYNFASPYNVIYAVKDMEKEGNWHAKNINGTGPYRFVEHVEGEKWVGKRYEDYHFKDNYIENTIAYRIKDITTPLVGGQIMGEFRSVSPPERANIEKQMGENVEFHEAPLMTQWGVTLNSKFKPFQDKRVRQALNLCIDRHKGLENLSKITFTGRRSSPILFGTKFAPSDAELDKMIGFSPDIKASRAKAKQLLKEAGHEGLTFKYVNRGVAHPYDHMGIFLISQWKACGLNPSMETAPTAKYVVMRRTGNFEATVDWQASFFADPTIMLQKYLSASRNPQNYAGYENPEFDKLYDAQAREVDEAKRKEIVMKMLHIFNDDSWFLPVAFAHRVVPLLAKVKGYHIIPTHNANNDYRGLWIEE
jgi:peptide/nickel transport system substrate-binding protein